MATLSVCFASADENDYIIPTVASVKCDSPAAEIVGVDDASATPQPCCRFRTSKRAGVSGARGIAAELAKGEAVAFMDPHIALDAETAQALWQVALAQAARAGRKCPQQFPKSPLAALQSSMAPGKLDSLARIALENRAVVYPRCWSVWRSHEGARFHIEGALRRVLWRDKVPSADPEPTSCCLGGLYVLPRELLEAFGGWPKLPAPYSMDEEVISMLAIAHRAPVLFATSVNTWHLFRGHKDDEIPVPFSPTSDDYGLNLAAFYRLMLDDAHWRDFRPTLAAAVKYVNHDKQEAVRPNIPEKHLARVEAGEFTRYRDSVQVRYKLSTAEILAELDRRMMADVLPGEVA